MKQYISTVIGSVAGCAVKGFATACGAIIAFKLFF